MKYVFINCPRQCSISSLALEP